MVFGRKTIFLIFLGVATTAAQAAGLKEITIPIDAKGPAIHALLWTPCATQANGLKVSGPITVQGVKDCPIEGSKLPLIVFSHGAGGDFLGHHDTAETLADAGFIVITFNHPLDSGRDVRRADDISALVERPTDVQRVADYMLSASSAAAQIDPRRVGFFGFSRGGFTGLALAGAIPDYSGEAVPPHPSAYDARFKAFVIADPLSLFPDKNSLRAVTAPVQLWSSEQGGQGVTRGKVTAIADGLPVRPEFHPVPIPRTCPS